MRLADIDASCLRLKSEFRNPKSEIGLVGEDRIELSPRVPRTRMLALHHTPKTVQSLKSNSLFSIS